MSWYVSVVII